MNQPLVTIICVSYNQASYLELALASIYAQSYANIEVIAVDDGSSDGSTTILVQWQKSHPNLKVLLLGTNHGYCKAFNKGWALAKGQYIIDLSADDVLLPSRVEVGVTALSSGKAGVHFCDAQYIDKHSTVVSGHFQRDSHGRLVQSIPQGNIYKELLKRYFICAPTMMIHRRVLEHLAGYDEELYYEDFDFWVRSSRHFSYCFTDQILVQKRVLKDSMSKTQYTQGSLMLASTAAVCTKAFDLNRTAEEHQALAIRLRYEIRQAILCNAYEVAETLVALLGRIHQNSWELTFWKWVIKQQLNVSFLNRFIRKAR